MSLRHRKGKKFCYATSGVQRGLPPWWKRPPTFSKDFAKQPDFRLDELDCRVAHV